MVNSSLKKGELFNISLSGLAWGLAYSASEIKALYHLKNKSVLVLTGFCICPLSGWWINMSRVGAGTAWMRRGQISVCVWAWVCIGGYRGQCGNRSSQQGCISFNWSTCGTITSFTQTRYWWQKKTALSLPLSARRLDGEMDSLLQLVWESSMLPPWASISGIFPQSYWGNTAKNSINIQSVNQRTLIVISVKWWTWCICPQPWQWTCSLATLWPEVMMMMLVWGLLLVTSVPWQQ